MKINFLLLLSIFLMASACGQRNNGEKKAIAASLCIGESCKGTVKDKITQDKKNKLNKTDRDTILTVEESVDNSNLPLTLDCQWRKGPHQLLHIGSCITNQQVQSRQRIDVEIALPVKINSLSIIKSIPAQSLKLINNQTVKTSISLPPGPYCLPVGIKDSCKTFAKKISFEILLYDQLAEQVASPRCTWDVKANNHRLKTLYIGTCQTIRTSATQLIELPAAVLNNANNVSVRGDISFSNTELTSPTSVKIDFTKNKDLFSFLNFTTNGPSLGNVVEFKISFIGLGWYTNSNKFYN